MKPSSADRIEMPRDYPVSRTHVFRAMSEARYVSQWFVPNREVTLEVDRFEFTPGGSYRFVYHYPDGTRSAISGVFQRIDQPRLLSFTWCWEAPDPHAGQQTLVTFQLTENHDRTILKLVHEQLPPDYRPVFSAGWQQTLNHLRDVAVALNEGRVDV